MSAICGWITEAPKPGTDIRALRAMAGVPDTPDINVNHTTCENAGLLSYAPYRAAKLGKHNDILVALDGHAWFKDGKLQELARARGFENVVAQLYRDRGPAVLQDLRGTFALAILDPKRREALLAVDRLGTRPLAYHAANDRLVFGSSLESIRAFPESHLTVDPQAIFDYFYFTMVPSPGTIYQDVFKLEPAQYVHWRNNQCRTAIYWQPEFVDQSTEGLKELKDDLHSILRRAIGRSDIDGHAGVFLSGGVDSSTVCGVYAAQSNQPVHTYSIGFHAEGYDEMHYAHIAARHFRAHAHEYYVTPTDVIETIPLIARTYDEPFGNSSAIAVYHCAKLARANGHQRMLAGDGGDELFGGNARYVKQKLFEQYGRLPGWLRTSMLEPLTFGIPGIEHLPLLRKWRRYVEQARIPLPDRLESSNPLHQMPLNDIFTPAFLAQIAPDQPLALLRDVYRRAPTRSAVNAMLYLDWKLTLADNDLRKVNRMCEAAGIEVGYPLLDDELVAFSARVPPDLKIHRFRLRHFFKEAMRDYLPNEIIRKSKHGFGLPFGVWLRNVPELQALASDALQRLKQREMLNPEYINRVMAAHREDHAAFYGAALWVLMIFELWLQHHERPPA